MQTTSSNLFLIQSLKKFGVMTTILQKDVSVLKIRIYSNGLKTRNINIFQDQGERKTAEFERQCDGMESKLFISSQSN